MIGCCIKLDFNLNLRAKRRCYMAMAKKAAAPVVQTKKPVAAPVAAAKPAPAVASTPVRNTPVPKGAVRQAAKKEVTYGDIAQRAYEIWASGQGGSEMDNWLRAERELRGA
jgi:hypothetical protein